MVDYPQKREINPLTKEKEMMNDYRITMAEDGAELEIIQAESATEALDAYCAGHPDDDTGFQRGGLNVDADTRGEVWATVRTDAGRINADMVKDGE